MSSTANSNLSRTDVCKFCDAPVTLVELDGGLHWTHTATGYYTCGLNAFHVAKAPWSEYEQWKTFTLATPSTQD